jgi:hypothetical protein
LYLLRIDLWFGVDVPRVRKLGLEP